ncbi:hypothetical protein C6V83_06070 [Gordonia iterans]|uniref:Uncharacterized protein n=1 Tax=Gordonia iterans TaxID=1004901 RepID=A0A2S0KDZ7_9ACTN|nr:hypothetical protein C6V83_06070 [Gordonia iterans]
MVGGTADSEFEEGGQLPRSGDGGYAPVGEDCAGGRRRGEAASGAASEESSTTTEDDVSELVSIEAVWRDRAKIAAEAAEELADLIPALRRVLSRNTLGEDCAEGEAMYGQLRIVVAGGVDVLRDAMTDAQVLASRCRASASAYAGADSLPE